MRRDIGLVKAILKEMADSSYNHLEARLALSDGPLEKGTDTERGKKNQRRAEHIRWMLDAGLLARLGPKHVRMTADGCEFLENSENAGVWNETKMLVASEGGSFGLEIVREFMKAYARKLIKEKTGLNL